MHVWDDTYSIRIMWTWTTITLDKKKPVLQSHIIFMWFRLRLKIKILMRLWQFRLQLQTTIYQANFFLTGKQKS
jgi:hypothetical protein